MKDRAHEIILNSFSKAGVQHSAYVGDDCLGTGWQTVHTVLFMVEPVTKDTSEIIN